MVLRLSNLLVAAIAALTLNAVPALAQDDPGEVVRHAATAMQRSANQTVENVQAATIKGVRTIQRLDDEGASERQLRAAAARALEVIDHEARQGQRRINLIASRAATILRDMGADRQYFAALHRARSASLDEVGESRRRGAAAIQAALEDALDD